MFVKIAILKETRPHEKRVALVPSVALKLVKLGAKLHMQRGAGAGIHQGDAAYPHIIFHEDRKTLLANADVVLCVQPPALDVIDEMKAGALLIGFIYGDQNPNLLQSLVAKSITSFAMERVPRITKAQSLGALSSQAALAGYYAFMLAAPHMQRVLPKFTTAAGVIGPAKVLVMGLGVAGLEALATGRRLGAIVEGYDVRPETEEQALSLGSTFIKTGVAARDDGGYAFPLSEQEKSKTVEILTAHIADADLIITTAAIPGQPSPKLISHAQVKGMKAGAVIVDLSADGGGNCDDTAPGKTITVGDVTIVAPLNVPSMLASDASELYSSNVYNLLVLIMKENALKIDWEDPVIAKTALTHAGVSRAMEASLPHTTLRRDRETRKRTVADA